jgi:hypothetical protein
MSLCWRQQLRIHAKSHVHANRNDRAVEGGKVKVKKKKKRQWANMGYVAFRASDGAT